MKIINFSLFWGNGRGRVGGYENFLHCVMKKFKIFSSYGEEVSTKCLQTSKLGLTMVKR